MMECVKISVIIPTYNAANYIESIIENILSQSHQNFEVIFADDGSTDESLLVARKYSQADPRIVALGLEHRGVSYARNQALFVSSGTIIVFVDADDELEEDYLESFVRIYTETECDLAVCSYIYETPQHEAKRTYLQTSDGLEVLDSLTAQKAVVNRGGFEGYVWNKAFRKSVICEYGITFDERISVYEDMLFVLDYLRHICKVVYTSHAKYHYIARNSGAMLNYDVERNRSGLEALFLIWNKVDSALLKKEMCSRLITQYLIWVDHLSKSNLRSSEFKLKDVKNMLLQCLNGSSELQKLSKYEKMMMVLTIFFGVKSSVFVRKFMNLWRK